MISTTMFASWTLLGVLVMAGLALALTMSRAEVHNLRLELAGTSNTNPWKSQLMLMLKSAQTVPASPSINKGSMLYGALVIEEAAETLVGLAKGIEEVSLGRGSDLYRIAVDFTQIARIMAGSSVAIRKAIAEAPDKPRQILISKEVAMEILDGCTDLHVVVSGLSLACGLPGQAGYDRVSTSNLSKANPVTGVIDKDPSGKWIKGINYQQPDLASLLSPYYNVVGQ